MNREGGVCLKKSWKPLFCSFKTFRTWHQVLLFMKSLHYW
jgi:hypothetical protein